MILEKIILASASPRRREILKSVGIPHKVVTSSVDEEYVGSPSPDELVKGLALRKLRAVKEEIGDERLILAADTVVYCDGIALGKPKDEVEAFSMLSMLSGRVHSVYTGIAMSKNGDLVLDSDETKVTFRELSVSETEGYIKTGEPFGKAGAYAIQEIGGVFVTRIEGSFHNVVGLPIERVVYHLINDYGIDIFDS